MITPRSFSKIIPSANLLPYPDMPIEKVSTDSRSVFNDRSTLFFALKTPYNDGKHFIEELTQKGVRNFVVHTDYQPLTKANYFFVEDTLKSLQKVAAFHRKKFDFPILLIAGSNGKTIVKEWLFHLSKNQLRVARSPKSYNSQIGVPHSLLLLKSKDQLGLIEAGISKPGEAKILSDTIQPTLGIFTNMGSAHSENFGSEREKVEEKAKLFEHCRGIIYCKDHTEIAKTLKSKLPHKDHITWSKHDKSADLFIKSICAEDTFTDIHGVYRQLERSIRIPFRDPSSIENCIHCWLTGLTLKLNIDPLQAAFPTLEPVEMRLETMQGIEGSTVINDTYNSDLNSIQEAISFLSLTHKQSKRVLILSDILESNINPRDITHLKDSIASANIETFIGIGTSISKLSPLATNINTYLYRDTDSFLSQIHKHSFRDKTVLCKGARRFRFEKIVNHLSLQKHDTLLEVDVRALSDNINFFREKLQSVNPKAEIMAVLKANSYSCGAREIAEILQRKGISRFAVAFTHEGIDLREQGMHRSILVFNPDQHKDLIQHGLEPSIFNVKGLVSFKKALLKSRIPQRYPIHLKLNTGMNRLGFEGDELKPLLSLLRQSPQLYVASIFSHLSSAGDERERRFTAKQIQTFQAMSQTLIAHLGYRPLLHILNTAGVLHHTQDCLDMVRIGIGLYGVGQGLKNVIGLKSMISQLRRVKAGESIGYDRFFRATRDMKTAVVPVGYADGIPRAWSEGGYVVIGGKKAAILGRISMDMMVVDVSGIACQERDEVWVLGQRPSCIEIAQRVGSVPHEVMVGISPRIKRIYRHYDR